MYVFSLHTFLYQRLDLEIERRVRRPRPTASRLIEFCNSSLKWVCLVYSSLGIR